MDHRVQQYNLRTHHVMSELTVTRELVTQGREGMRSAFRFKTLDIFMGVFVQLSKHSELIGL